MYVGKFLRSQISKLRKQLRMFFIDRKLKGQKNIYDSTNFLYGGGKLDLYHTRWGRHSGIGNNPFVYDTIVGNFTNIASNCKIGLRDHIYENFLISDFVYNGEQILPEGLDFYDGYWIKIGSDVWIGDGVIIMKGVKIGNGAVIAAGSVVTKSVPDFAIVGGIPARFIKWRFPKDVREKLENLQWWEWDDNKIIEEKNYLSKIVGFNIRNYKANYIREKPFVSIPIE